MTRYLATTYLFDRARISLNMISKSKEHNKDLKEVRPGGRTRPDGSVFPYKLINMLPRLGLDETLEY